VCGFSIKEFKKSYELMNQKSNANKIEDIFERRTT